jgi:GT2 family glycosyltransferase
VLRDHQDAWVIGRVVHPEALRGTPFGRWRDDQWERFHREQPGGLAETVGITAAHLALPRRDFLRLGGFDERFPLAGCEDAELGLRARAAGVRILYDPENLVVHDDWATSLPRYCERQRLYAVTDALLFRTYGARSPRAALVRANAPRSREDSARARARKAAKALLATRPGRAVLAACCAIAERIWPDRAPSHRFYQLAVGVAIFRGVREGLRRFPEQSA